MPKIDNKTTLIDFKDDDKEIEEKKTIQVPIQPDFFKVPRRFGNIPIDEIPTGYGDCLNSYQPQRRFDKVYSDL